MVRKAKKQAVSAKMYTHFAAITIGATVLLALFADGEEQQAVAEAVQREAATAQAAAAKHAKAKESYAEAQRRASADSSWSFDDRAEEFGAPTLALGADNPSSSSIFTAGDYDMTDGALFSSLSQIGVNRIDFLKMSEADRRRAVDRAKAKRERQIARIANASRTRSGGGEGLDM